MTPHTTAPLLWDGAAFRPITDLPDLTEWDETSTRMDAPELGADLG